MVVNLLNGVHEGIRTPDRTLRRRVLYPAELRRPLSLDCSYIIAYLKEMCKHFLTKYLFKFNFYFSLVN